MEDELYDFEELTITDTILDVVSIVVGMTASATATLLIWKRMPIAHTPLEMVCDCITLGGIGNAIQLEVTKATRYTLGEVYQYCKDLKLSL